jgi:hypothetical protein
VTRAVASSAIPSSGWRRLLLGVSCGITLVGCGGVGDLFPAPSELASGELLPAAEGAAPSAEPASAAPPVSVGPKDIGVAAGTGAKGERPLAPSARDDGADENEAGGAEATPTAAAPAAVPGEPSDELQPEAPPEGAPVGEAGAPPEARVCSGMQSPVLLDFEAVTGDGAQALFGDFDAVLSGGTYVYPVAAPVATGGPPNAAVRGLVSDVTAGDWRISGSVVEPSGFGVFLDCQLLDASRFAGIAFRIAGNVGNTDALTVLVGTASNEVSSSWRLENGGAEEPSSGRCTPSFDEYDGTCNAARIDIDVSAESREVFVPFSALGGGSPEPGVNPEEITTLAWSLPTPGVTPLGNAMPYVVNLRIDDIRFVEAPPAR